MSPAPTDTAAWLPHAPASVDAKKPRVLVADDDLICRTLAQRTLRGLGVEADVVKDGAEAVQAFEARHYDLVLMDCHMPTLDGFGAVQRMRAGEAPRGRRVPIVALTASAEGEELERCRDVGMDGHVSKLCGPQELRDTLAVWLARLGAARAPAAAPSPAVDGTAARRPVAAGADCLDLTVLADLLAFSTEDDDLIGELRASFEINVAQQLPLLEQAARAANADSVRFIAHRLRSTCGNLGARRMQFLCERLEALGRDGVTAGAPELIDDLAREFDRARAALDAWMRAHHRP